MTPRRIHQRQVFALLLAIAALVVPLSGAALYGGTAAFGSDTAFLFLGAISQSDFVPVLMLVGAFGILVASAGAAPRSTSLEVFSAGVIVAAGATLALGYLGSAYHLRPGGAFGMAEGGTSGEWSSARLLTVGSLVVTGVLCGVVVLQAGTWIGQRTNGTAR